MITQHKIDLMIVNLILHSIHKMSLFIISTHIERCKETTKGENILVSKVKTSRGPIASWRVS